MKLAELQKRVDELILLAEQTLTSEYSSGGRYDFHYVSKELYIQFRTSCLSFILNLYGEEHPHFLIFQSGVGSAHPENIRIGRGVLKSIKDEIDNGWLFTIKGVVSAEIFADFLEMAEYLLSEQYKDPAAVMAGSVLEEHLRQLCLKNNISTENTKDERIIPKKADSLNSELVSAGVYSKLDQKSITGWLDLRNKAAHGKYDEYTQQQVNLMLGAVRDFIGRNSL